MLLLSVVLLIQGCSLLVTIITRPITTNTNRITSNNRSITTSNAGCITSNTRGHQMDTDGRTSRTRTTDENITGQFGLIMKIRSCCILEWEGQPYGCWDTGQTGGSHRVQWWVNTAVHPPLPAPPPSPPGRLLTSTQKVSSSSKTRSLINIRVVIQV